MTLSSKKGFTLIEMLLVMVIIGMMLYAAIGYIQQRSQAIRIDRTSAQMQQILNAGLSYYIANGTWPDNIIWLQNGYYLPYNPISKQMTSNMFNPWGQAYLAGPNTSTLIPIPPLTNPPPNFAVWTYIPQSGKGATATATAEIISGTLPLSYTTATAGTTTTPPPPPQAGGSACKAGAGCYVVAMVNIPGQNLNNARGVNFAGLYHHGACVPVPQCPVDSTGATMTPQIMVAPVSVSGFDPNFTTNTYKTYPITSFTAYAVGSSPLDFAPPPCSSTSYAPYCDTNRSGNPAQAYWRVCLQLVTEQGNVEPTNSNWGKFVTLLAITRCAVKDEPAGSNFDVYSN